MALYEFITPSDPITFYAADDDVAFAATLLVGNAHAFCDRIADGGSKQRVDGCDFYIGSIPQEVKERLKRIVETRKGDLAAAFRTFAVCPPECRKEYDVYTDNSENEERWKEWDDRKRTSMTNWCGYARGLKFKDRED